MTEAFKCDVCGEYHEGEPEKEYYEKQYPQKTTEYVKALDVCADCVDEIHGDDSMDEQGYDD